MGKILVFLFLAFSLHAGCPFCNEKVIQLQKVDETENFYLLLDYEPRVEGHLLVVSKEHAAKAHEIPPHHWEELGLLTAKIDIFFRQFLQAEDYLILEKNGQLAFQDIPHVHFHYIPVKGEHWMEIFGKGPQRLSEALIVEKQAAYSRFFQENRA